jgi:hypothetical protein
MWCAMVTSAALAGAQMGSGMPSKAAAPQSTTLQLAGLAGAGSVVTPGELASMPHTSVTVENGHTHASETYSGVPLIQLLRRVGAPEGKDVHGKALSDYILATGTDGYQAVLALAEIEPDFHPGEVLVADTMDGKPLTGDGQFKLIVSEDKHPARCVHNLQKLELRAVQ